MKDVSGRLFRLVGRGLQWWLSELAGCVPGRWRRRPERQGSGVWLSLQGSEAVLGHRRGAVDEEILRFGCDGMSSGGIRDLVRESLRRAKLRNAGLRIRLDGDRALRRRITLPLAAERHLRDVLAFEMDRQTPFRSGEVHFTYRVAERSSQRQQLVAELIVVPRSTIAPLLRNAEGWGLKPEQIEVGTDEQDGPILLPLAGADEQRTGRRLARRLNLAMGACAVALALAAAYVPLYENLEFSARLDRDIAEARRSAEAVIELRRQVDLLSEDARFLSDQRSSTLSPLRVLNEVTRRAPDNTWVYELRLNGTEIQLLGFSASATNLIALIEDAPDFHGTRLRSPLTRSPQDGMERFHLSFEAATNKEKEVATR